MENYYNIKIAESVLERNFDTFSEFIRDEDGKLFTAFADSKYVDDNEGYKYTVFENARAGLKYQQKQWGKQIKPGSGEIKQAVSNAIQTKVVHNGISFRNNLIDWRKKDDFDKLEKSETLKLEQLLFNFYKSNKKDEVCFGKFLELGLEYQLIAYLYFIKTREKFMPIAQNHFDLVFKNLLDIDFKTKRNASWENYSTYINLIEQTRDFLKTKDPKTTLLDAHTFLYIIGDEIENPNNGDIAKKAKPQENKKDTEEPESSNTDDDNDKPAEAFSYAEELPENIECFEGLKKRVTINSYERNATARKQCIEFWKEKQGQLKCAVCEFDFEKTYGEIGRGFIHVHHLTPISTIGENYEINPKKDLIPVCPNCHSMIHKKDPPFSIQKMKDLLKRDGTK